MKAQLTEKPIKTSVPCRIDMGGTLDISTIYLPLQAAQPSTFNIALGLRTFVTLNSYKKGYIKISSKGFETAEFKSDPIPFIHPLGLMFAIAKYFNADGVHIDIKSTSPPRSALGGSSSAAVALVAAFFKLLQKELNPAHIVWLAHYIEAGVARVPCGVQDQLAAAYGGVNQWFFAMDKTGPAFKRETILEEKSDIEELNNNILIAYCGIPHESKDINQKWINSFLKGETQEEFKEIAGLSRYFSKAIRNRKFALAGQFMNIETEIRLKMTPEVLDNTGKKLFEIAKQNGCGARFTGAGGGGCLWAIGESDSIRKLHPQWWTVLKTVKDAKILKTGIDKQGICVH
jgi:D-glycero-alpha-D-manno-heptose-7-phosphate kinase